MEREEGEKLEDDDYEECDATKYKILDLLKLRVFTLFKYTLLLLMNGGMKIENAEIEVDKNGEQYVKYTKHEKYMPVTYGDWVIYTDQNNI